jgi:hypothetical protein
MNAHVDKAQENAASSQANAHVKQQGEGASLEGMDQRPAAIAQRKLQGMADNSRGVKQLMAFREMGNKEAKCGQQLAMQKKENKTGLPDNLKSGIEQLSGYAMDDVKVHYNSDKPAQLQAQALGTVRPTSDSVSANGDCNLEMANHEGTPAMEPKSISDSGSIVQRLLQKYEQRLLESERLRLNDLVAKYEQEKAEILSKLILLEQNMVQADVVSLSFLRERTDEMFPRIDDFFKDAATIAREAISSSAKLRKLTAVLNGFQKSGGQNEILNMLKEVRRRSKVPQVPPTERDKTTDVTPLDEKYFVQYLKRSKPPITVYRGDGRGVKADFLDQYIPEDVIAGGTTDISFVGVLEHTHTNTLKNGMVSTTTDRAQAKEWAIGKNKYGVVYEFNLKNYIHVDEILLRRGFKSRYAAQKEIMAPGNISASDIVSVTLYGQKGGLIKKI